ncbi:hypothetical protein [Paraburkholderia sp. CI3]|uniref:hypothetical protein n=1 Tax=Paraburkholderia sp. CI3 TaxID=2991060 RepID=UPI003D1E5AEB
MSYVKLKRALDLMPDYDNDRKAVAAEVCVAYNTLALFIDAYGQLTAAGEHMFDKEQARREGAPGPSITRNQLDFFQSFGI